MAPPTAAQFERHLRSLEERAFVRFVATLWETRGWETRVGAGGRILVATDPVTGDRRLIYCHSGRPTVRERLAGTVHDRRSEIDPGDVDVVVADREAQRARQFASEADAAFRGPKALHSALFYGIDREDADRLLRTHFGRAFDADDWGRGGAFPTLSHSIGRSKVGVVAVGLLILVALVGGSLATGIVGVGSSPDEIDPESTAGGEVIEAQADGDDDEAGALRAGERSHPPGVSDGGIEDVSELSEAHLEFLDGHAYHWHLQYQDVSHRPGSETGWFWAVQTVSVERDYRYHSQLTGVPNHWDSIRWVDRHEYADGEAVYYRFGGGETVYDRKSLSAVYDTGGPVGGMAERHLRGYLDTPESAVEPIPGDDQGRIRLVATGDPRRVPIETTNYTAIAIVHPTGFVESLSVEYEYAERDGRVAHFSFQYVLAENVTVVEPDWYETARNETGGVSLGDDTGSASDSDRGHEE